jgi:hypothetical protein
MTTPPIAAPTADEPLASIHFLPGYPPVGPVAPSYPPEWDDEELCPMWQCVHEDRVCDSTNEYWIEDREIDIYRVICDLLETCAEAKDKGLIGGTDAGAVARNQVEFWSRKLGYSPPLPARSTEQRRATAAVANKRQQRVVWDRDGWQCVRCGEHRWLTVDHIIPVHRGGTEHLDNKQTLCGPCNSRKGTR